MGDPTPKPVTVTIFDKEYTVGCPEGERDSLFAAVEFLNERMSELRDGGKVIGTERIAVMSALNIAHEFLMFRSEHTERVTRLDERLARIDEKVQKALTRGREVAASNTA